MQEDRIPDAASDSSSSTEKKKDDQRGYGFHRVFTLLLEVTLGCAALVWFIYAYLPEYYLELSFVMLAIVGIFAYVILIKSAKI